MTDSPVSRSPRAALKRVWLGCWAEQILQQTLRGLCFGLALALGGALVLTIRAGLTSPESLNLLVAIGLVLGILSGLLRPPSRLRAARLADERLGLEDRLGTAAELLRQQSHTPFEQAQLADAARQLSASPGRRRGRRLRFGRTEVLTALALTAILVAALRLEGRAGSLLVGRGAPNGAVANPADQRQPVVAAAPAIRPGADSTAPTSDALRLVDELARARESGALSEERAGQELNRLESDLRQRSAAARQQTQSVDRLAQALGQVSASEAAADSLRQGDREQAADQLRDLGREADQLSPEAKAQLAQALREAAADGRTDRTLADRERRAADALASRDYPDARSALSQLGDELARSARNSDESGALADALQRLDQERSASGANGDPNPGNQTAGAGAAARETLGGRPGDGQSGGSQAAGSQAGTGEGGNQPGPGSGGAAGDLPAASRAAAEGSGGGRSGAGGLGDGAPPLDVAGQPAEVPARPSSPVGGLPTDQSGNDDQPIGGATLPANDTGQPAAPVQAGGSIERVIVPGDQRSVVRDYFARRTGKGTP